METKKKEIIYKKKNKLEVCFTFSLTIDSLTFSPGSCALQKNFGQVADSLRDGGTNRQPDSQKLSVRNTFK